MEKNEILHIGTVLSVEGTHMKIKVMKDVQCSTCNAKKLCTTGTDKSQIMDIYHVKGAQRFERGDDVQVTGTPEAGFKAACLVFGMPVLLAALGYIMAQYAWHLGEVNALLLVVLIWCIYYTLLSFTKKWWSNNFTFNIEKLSSANVKELT